ncbi:hypothetical protein [Vibrio diabolicus]|uniref:Uncharacterized protein n=1 Tax=Vibrio diabolicus TaxID=50719 RepID=A0ABM6S7B7_9VIBR|nr:hypothetical protein [Vibrio diabolicus]AVH25990.1 hypothetical protein AL468_01640 [Vibrio diabolicus]
MKIGEVASKTSASQMFAPDAPSWGASFNTGRGVAILSLFIQFKCVFCLHYKWLDFNSFHSKHSSQEVHDKSMRLIFLIGNDQMYLY